MPPPIRPLHPSAIERGMHAFVGASVRVPGLRRLLLSPVIARPGYWFATGAGLLWAGILSGFRVHREGGVIVAPHMPRWSFGRGGTTIGAVFLTNGQARASVLEHEAVHRAQWRRYGLVLIPLYIAAGVKAETNRFEVEAGLEKAGYR